MKIKRRPPGRPWYRPSGSSKVCLLCLKRFDASALEEDEESSAESEEEDPSSGDTNTDPLSVDGDPGKYAKSGDDNPPPLKAKRKRATNMYLRFLTILSRHVGLRTHRFRKAASQNKLPPPFCGSCKVTIQSLCDAYEEWTRAELMLRWRLGRAAEVINLSKGSVSGKLAHTLVKSLSTQLHVASSTVVEFFRRQVAIRCSAKAVKTTPKVSISRNSCLEAMKEKLQFPILHMQQYLKSLIAVFTLAVPPKVVPPPKKPNMTHHFGKRKVNLERGEKLKSEPGEEGSYGDDHFADYSPPNSGPNSPIANDNEADDQDSDWDAKGNASANDSGSDVEFTVNSSISRRWNLRRRRKRGKKEGDEENEYGEEKDEDYVPGVLPPLRRPRGSVVRNRVDESQKTFACNLCNQRFNLERSLKRHIGYSHAFLMQYACTLCPLRFKKHKDLIIHKRKIHPSSGTEVGKAIADRWMGRPTKCTVCDKVFPSKVKMMIHRKTHKVMEIVHTCEICGKVIRGKFRIEFHMKRHNRTDKPHQCTKCPRNFGTQQGLTLHLQLHARKPDWMPVVRKKKARADVIPREMIYKCEIEDCGKIFYKQCNLTLHMSLHEKNFTCEVCAKTFILPREIRKHLMKVHENENKCHFCLHCDKSYTIPQTLDFHLKMCHPSKAKLTCDDDYCVDEFDTTDQLLEHLKQVHLENDKEGTKYMREQEQDENKATDESVLDPTTGLLTISSDENIIAECGTADIKPTPTERELEEGKDERGIFTCERCKWSFCSKLNLTLHSLIHTARNDRNQYECKLCDKAFPVLDSLQTHHNKVHGPRIKPYMCLQCGIRFHRKESFIPHLRMHKEKAAQATFECTFEGCKRKFDDSNKLRKHIKVRHDLDPARRCDECNETFTTRLVYLTHMHTIHGKEKEFKCDAEGCEKTFFLQYQLTDHMICHTEGKFLCPLCPKVFRRRHNLEDHILVHKQEKNHICHYCGKAFVKKSSLNLHLAIHRGDKNYKCRFCEKAFCRKFAKDCHERIHTNEKPFHCEICGQAFSQYSSFKNHLKVHEKLNNSKVKRRPFKKSIGIGQPLRKTAKSEEESGLASTVDAAAIGIEIDPEAPTAAGIMHEALQAAFNDIASDLVRGDDEGPPPVPEKKELRSSESEEEENEASPQPVVEKKRRNPRKSFLCGICGKKFVREKPYNAHVARHLTVDAILDPKNSGSGKGGNSSQQQDDVMDDAKLSETLSGAKEEEEEEPIFKNEPMPVVFNNYQHQNTTLSAIPAPPTLFQFPEEITPTTSARTGGKVTRGRGRPPRADKNTTPGSRLARIVEGVIEAATNNQFRASSAGVVELEHDIQGHQHQQSHNMHHSVIQSPSPSQHLHVHSGSERSTPVSGHDSPVPSTAPTPPSTSSSLSFPPTSFLSPFLYGNPYLLPRQDGQQQTGGAVSVQQHHNQQQAHHPQQTFPAFSTTSVQTRLQSQQQQQQQILNVPFSQQQQQSQINYTNTSDLQLHHLQQMARSASSSRAQDLSKNSYAMFYANPR